MFGPPFRGCDTMRGGKNGAEMGLLHVFKRAVCHTLLIALELIISATTSHSSWGSKLVVTSLKLTHFVESTIASPVFVTQQQSFSDIFTSGLKTIE